MEKDHKAEIIVEVVDELDNIDKLEGEFSKFIDDLEKSQKGINTIQMDELNDISEEIIKAKQYLTSFASGESKSVRTKAYNQLTQLPLIGNWAKEKAQEMESQDLKDAGVEDVLDGMFKSFDAKKQRLIELTGMAEKLKTTLMFKEKSLGEYIVRLDKIIQNPNSAVEKMKAIDLSIMAQSQDRITKEMIYNNLEFIIELLENLMIKISKTLPVLKQNLNNSLSIVGTINSIKDSLEMMNTLEGLTNEISRTSTENIQGLIVDVTKSLGESTDISFYEESAKRNEEYHKLLTTERVKYIEKSVSNYDKLKVIEENSQALMLERVKQEAKAIGFKGKPKFSPKGQTSTSEEADVEPEFITVEE
jgi:hypothetical protein